MNAPRLEGYADIEPVGRGGIGDVYRARRTSTGATVALKVIRDLTDASAARRRIDREVAALVALGGHPYVVHVEEVVYTAAGPVMIMEYVGGGSLADRLAAHGVLRPAELTLVGLHVATALRDAHGRGIVHRDVKPHNLLVGEFGQVKLCDFGIAALAREAAGGVDRTGALSYRYASPEELADGPTLGPPADVYSLGVTIRHLATGSARAGAAWTLGSTEAESFVATNCEHLVAQMTAAEPGRRPSAAHVVQAFASFERHLGGAALRALPLADDATTVRRRVARGLPRLEQAPLDWWETS